MCVSHSRQGDMEVHEDKTETLLSNFTTHFHALGSSLTTS